MVGTYIASDFTPCDLKVEEEMLMRKLYELMSAEGLIRKVISHPCAKHITVK